MTLPGHLAIVAAGFRVAGAALGLPSLALLIWVGWGVIGPGDIPPPDSAEPLDIKTYGLVALLANGARGIGEAFRWMAVLTSWLAILLTLAALVSTLIAAALYLIGRGIGHHSTTARILAALASLGLLAAGAGLILLRRDLAPVASLPIGVSLYTLWVLGWRFV